MKYSRFEQLPVWQAAIQLSRDIYDFVKSHRLRLSFRDQFERAGLSISNNIAEGFERGTTKELLTFLYIARGSAGEVRSMLCVLETLEEFHHLKSEISNLKSSAESISRQLHAWADHLQNSEIKGQRHLTNTARRKIEENKQRDAFWAQVNDIVSRAK